MKWGKWIAAATLALYLCVLPVHAEQVDAVEKSLVPVEGVGAAARVVSPLLIPRAETGNYTVCLEFSGLKQDLWLVAERTNGQLLGETAVSAQQDPAAAVLLLTAPDATESLNLRFFDRKGGNEVYQPVGLLLAFPADLPFDAGDALACTQTSHLSVLAESTAVTACLPLGTEDPDKLLYGTIVDAAGTVYGSAQTAAAIKDTLVPDSRFAAVFQKNPYRALVQALQTDIPLSRPLSPGTYDVLFVDAAGVECYRFCDAVVCDDRPAVQIEGWTEIPLPGSRTVGVRMYLANGSPGDFVLELYRDGTLLGSGTHTSVWGYEDSTDRALLDIAFDLAEPVEAGEGYAVHIRTETPYHGECSVSLPPVTEQSGRIDLMASGFDSAYFANVLLKTAGFAPKVQYKALLRQENQELSQCLAVCSEDGFFDLAFVDRSGEPVAVTPGEIYTVSLYRWQSGGQWTLMDDVCLRAPEASTADAGGAPVSVQADRISVHAGLLSTGEMDEPLSLQLFGPRNGAGEPDYSETLTETTGYALTDKGNTLFSAERYHAVWWKDDRVAGVQADGYWVDARCMEDYRQMQAWGIPNFTLKTEQGAHGTITLYSGAEPLAEAENWLDFTEIYVHAIPDAGYELDTVVVNGKSIEGNAFLLAENVTVSAVFKPRQAETFSITLQHNPESDPTGGEFFCQMEQAALGDRVTLTVRPAAQYWLTGVRVLETETGLAVTIEQIGTSEVWQFVMPGTAVTAEVTFMPKVRCAITVAAFDLQLGQVTVPGFGWEGDPLTATVQPSQGCTLNELWLVYELAGSVHKENLLLQSDEQADTYTFTVPCAATAQILPVFREHRFAVQLPDDLPQGIGLTASHETARPGSCVTVTVLPGADYRLVEDGLSVCTQTGAAVAVSPSEKAHTWSFIMPWEAVQISAAFESTHPGIRGVTVEETASGQLQLAVQVHNASAGTGLIAALYDANHRLLHASVAACTADAASQTVCMERAVNAASGQLFLVQTDGFAPLSQPFALPLAE